MGLLTINTFKKCKVDIINIKLPNACEEVRVGGVVHQALKISIKSLTVNHFTIQDFPSTQRTHVITGTRTNNAQRKIDYSLSTDTENLFQTWKSKHDTVLTISGFEAG